MTLNATGVIFRNSSAVYLYVDNLKNEAEERKR
ncbi:MAG: hypothetical protein QOG00_1955 [Pyrinomonadaceae bacterium]|nr:hypothetical protein [Pyrinomonadaceae bacterium]MDX6269347.1 hypothetical protein [Acidobacteriota bacterium]